MKYTLSVFTVFISLLLTAQGDKMNPEKITNVFFKNKTINLVGAQSDRSLYPDMKAGNMVVFHYTKKHAENPDMSDDEMSESVMFEVDASWNNFIFMKKLPMSKATYNLGCFCVERGYFNITGGYIKGKKLANGNYYIEADATITYNNGNKKAIKFKGEFSPADEG